MLKQHKIKFLCVVLFLFLLNSTVVHARRGSDLATDRDGRIIRGMFIGGTAPIVSPKVLPDKRVTFRLRAPNAAQVRVTGEILPSQNDGTMTRDDNGVWSVTIGPLTPDVYGYSFNIDGVTISC